MNQTRALLIAFPLALSVMACTTYGADDSDEASPRSEGPNSEAEDTVAEDTNSNAEETASDAEKDKFLESINFCKEDDLGRFIGMQATDETVAEAVAASNSKVVRVLAPGMSATMDYRTNRLNVMTDENGVILQMRCG